MTTDIDAAPERTAVELASQSGGREWGTYDVSIDRANGTTTVSLDIESSRRFELARLTQLVAASRYREAVLEAEGDTVLERERSVGIASNICERLHRYTAVTVSRPRSRRNRQVSGALCSHRSHTVSMRSSIRSKTIRHTSRWSVGHCASAASVRLASGGGWK